MTPASTIETEAMKRITAYVNTVRVHWLAEELVAAGVKEIRVIEHFSPTSQISRLQLCCADELVGRVREIIRRLGTCGVPPDFDLVVADFDPNLPSQIPMGQRMSVLEEPQLARRIRSLFKGASTKVTAIFLAITVSIGAVGVFTHFRLEQFQYAARMSADNVRTVIDAASTIQTAHLEELLAAEQFHRGDTHNAVRVRLGAAVEKLQESQLVTVVAIDSLVEMENRFQSDLGSDDGIQVGDTLAVWRRESSGATVSRTVLVGSARATRILDEHHAAVEVLKGSLQELDSVEKKAL